MDKENMGLGTGIWGVLILIFLFFIVFNNNGGGLFGGNGNGGSCTTVCEAEKQEIVDSARNFWQIGNTASETQKLIIAEEAQTRSYLGNKIDFYAYEGLKDQLSQERSKNIVLEQKIDSNSQFNSIRAELCSIRGNMVDRPPFYAAGGMPCASIYPTGCGTGVA